MVPGCSNERPRGHLMCRGHWKLVPYDLREAVSLALAAFRRNRKDGVHIYRDARNAAVDYVATTQAGA
jgi:hypothetical protein